jgi:hypothetical protein
MAEEKRSEGQAGKSSTGSASQADQQTGDPGRTPGTAEGDRETVEEDLESKEGGGK